MTTAQQEAKLLNVFIIDEDRAYGMRLSAQLQNSKSIAKTSYFSDAVSAISTILNNNPEVILIGPKLSGVSGIGAIRIIRESDYTGEILLISAEEDDDLLITAIQAGAAGFIAKNNSCSSGIVNAILDSVNGGAPVPTHLMRKVIDKLYRKRRFPRTPAQTLSQREREILFLFSNGHSCRKIAEIFSISYHTVRTHQKNLYKKLNVNSITEAIAKLRHFN
jgi:DNA-binding NarL/FixJ family response regulator